ncbi:MAG: ATP-dependent helicase [Candidatus Kapabacteria bacterium]|nr:ATP-dependent helicase [Candidatus Kapabacteria bacterium]
MVKKIILKKTKFDDVGIQKSYKINYEQDLNLSQYDAVMHSKGPALVIAGAGTGKTRTLIYRVSRLIEDGIPPESILLLTFTRKASQEMLSRAALLLDGRAESVSGGTFHSFASLILRQYAQVMGYASNFTILDQSDSQDVINLLRHEFAGKNEKRRFPTKATISKIWSLAVNTQSQVDELIEEQFPWYLNETDKIKELIFKYVEYKKRYQLMDYDDLLLNLLFLMKNHPDILEKINKKYTQVMVDEYQDTNRLQHEIILYLAGKNKNVLAVGDDAQSIYSFRGANYQNIMFFPDSFEECKIYKIEENYRSIQPILNFSNTLMSSAIFKYEKNLFSKRESTEMPKIISSQTERMQSKFLVQQILEHREENIPLEDMAILFRSSFHAFDLEIELEKANIPFRKFGGLKFMEVAHVKDIIAYLRILANPIDAVSWQRVLKILPGVGPMTVDKVLEQISDNQVNTNDYTQLDSSLRSFEHIHKLFKNLGEVSKSKLSIADKTALLTEYYRPYLQEKYDDWQKRWKDLETLISISERYRSLDNFLNELSLDPPNESVSELTPESKEEEYLTLSTIHSAKGLEWRVVFLIWALEGKFPSSKSTDSLDQMEEERRLFYVACTRAKDYLYVTYPTNIFDRESGFVLSEPSRFLENITDEFAERYVITEEEEEE